MIEYQTTEYKTEKCIVRVHKPILTEEERKKREEEVKKAIIEFEKEIRRVKK